MAAAKEKPAVLGTARCPLCGGSATVKLSGSGFAYLAMDCCKAQLFARGATSDEHLRDLIGRAPAGAKPHRDNPLGGTPAPSPAPAAQAPAAKAPAPTPAPSPAPSPVAPEAARDQPGFGLLKDWFKS